jgi:hypothetical protein
MNRIPEFPQMYLEYLRASQRSYSLSPVWLGGTSGSNGGVGGPPGGFLGQLPQSKVTYDTTEASAILTSGSSSLVDNLNHIRWMITSGSFGSFGSIGGSGVAGRVAVWTSASSLGSYGGFTYDSVGGVLSITSGSGYINQSAAYQVWNNKVIKFDAPTEIDTTGATSGSFLGYNGTKWVPMMVSASGGGGGSSGISGSGTATQIAYFTSGSVLSSTPSLAWNTSGSSLDVSQMVSVYGYSNAGDPGATVPGTSETYPRVVGYRSRGSSASKSAVQGGDFLLFLGAFGYDGSAYSSKPSAFIDFEAAEAFTSGSYGSAMRFWITRPNTAEQLSVSKMSSTGWTVGISNPGIVTRLSVANNDTANPNSQARVSVFTSGSNSGDPYLLLNATDQYAWTVGIDNSDSDKFKIDLQSVSVAGTTLANIGGNTALSIDSSLLPTWSLTSQVWGGKTIKFDASTEIDSSGATSGSLLGFNGSKWIPVMITSGSGGEAAIDSDAAMIPAVNGVELGSTPSSPGTGHRKIYAKSDGWYDENSTGTETLIGPLANTSVTPGSYTTVDLTVDAKGRITAVKNGTGNLQILVSGASPTTPLTNDTDTDYIYG